MPLTNIVKNINVNVGFGYMIEESESGLEQEYSEYSDRLSFKTLVFHLRTADGRYAPMKDASISMAILFALR